MGEENGFVIRSKEECREGTLRMMGDSILLDLQKFFES
jgi:hypothetical protein